MKRLSSSMMRFWRRLRPKSWCWAFTAKLFQPFSQAALQPGFHTTSIHVSPIDVRVMLLGHEFGRFVSAQASYMRPANYVTFGPVAPGDADQHHVRVNFGTVTIKLRAPIHDRVSAYGEGGIGFTSRTGFAIGDTPAVTDAHFASPVAGGGIEYRVNAKWSLTAGLTYVPGKAAISQPRTIFTSGGFTYTMRPLPPERVAANRDAGFIFPRQVIQIAMLADPMNRISQDAGICSWSAAT